MCAYHREAKVPQESHSSEIFKYRRGHSRPGYRPRVNPGATHSPWDQGPLPILGYTSQFGLFRSVYSVWSWQTECLQTDKEKRDTSLPTNTDLGPWWRSLSAPLYILCLQDSHFLLNKERLQTKKDKIQLFFFSWDSCTVPLCHKKRPTLEEKYISTAFQTLDLIIQVPAVLDFDSSTEP